MRRRYSPSVRARAAACSSSAAGLDQGEHVRHGGVHGGPVGEQVDGPAEDDFLAVVDGPAADEGAQGQEQGDAPAADLQPELGGVGAAHAVQDGAERSGVERVDPVQAASDA